jgi:ATP-dependent DNA helicase RecQ
VFGEQWQALAAQLARASDAPLVYRGLFARDPEYAGLAAALGAMGIPLLEGDDLIEDFAWLLQEKVCGEALQRLTGSTATGR